MSGAQATILPARAAVYLSLLDLQSVALQKTRLSVVVMVDSVHADADNETMDDLRGGCVILRSHTELDGHMMALFNSGVVSHHDVEQILSRGNMRASMGNNPRQWPSLTEASNTKKPTASAPAIPGATHRGEGTIPRHVQALRGATPDGVYVGWGLGAPRADAATQDASCIYNLGAETCESNIYTCTKADGQRAHSSSTSAGAGSTSS